MKVQVLLPKIFNYTFTYIYDQKKKYKIGDIVEVPFGSKIEIGVIWKGINTINKLNNINKIHKQTKIKKVRKRLEDYSLSEKLIQFIEWFSMYNMVPKGLTLKMCIGGNENFFKKIEKKIYDKKTKSEKYKVYQFCSSL